VTVPSWLAKEKDEDAMLGKVEEQVNARKG
jgi:hypothetical protein